MRRASQDQAYDVALSFAGEDRDYVALVAEILADHSVSVFYDSFEKVDLWGRDLYQFLADVYSKARFTVIFISRHYAAKRWTNHELRAAQVRAFVESQDCILPARFDSSDVPGILPTTGYIELSHYTPNGFAHLVLDKIGWQRPSLEGSVLRRRRIERIVRSCLDAEVQAQPDRWVEHCRDVEDTFRILAEEESVLLGRTAPDVIEDLLDEISIRYSISEGRAMNTLAAAANAALKALSNRRYGS